MDKNNSTLKIDKIVKRLKEIKLNKQIKPDTYNKYKEKNVNKKLNGTLPKAKLKNGLKDSTMQDSNQSIKSLITNEAITIRDEEIELKKKMKQNSEVHSGLNKEEMSSILMNIFNNHATFNKEEKDYFLPSRIIFKIFQKLSLASRNIKTNSTSQCEVELLLQKVNPKGIQKLNSKQFMNFIAVYAEKIYGAEEFNKNPKIAIEKIIIDYFLPYSNYIDNMTRNNFEQEDENENFQKSELYSENEHFPSSGIYFHKNITNLLNTFKIDKNLIFLINSIYKGLKNIYITYFYYEVNTFKETYKIIYGSFNNLAEMCKNFEICPYIISLDKLAVLFDVIVNIREENITNNQEFPVLLDPKKEVGKIFTLSKFCLLLIHLGIFAFDKISKNFDLGEYITKENELDIARNVNHNNNVYNYCYPSKIKNEMKLGDLGNAEKLLLFFERLESSEGGNKTGSKNNKLWNMKLSLVPSVEVMEKINPMFVKFFGKSKTSESTTNSKKSSNPISKFLYNFSQFSLELREKFETHLDTFAEIFQHYSQYGNKLSGAYITISAFIKFLKDASLTEQSIRKISITLSKQDKCRSPSPIKNNTLNKSSLRPMNSENVSNLVSNQLKNKLTDSDAAIIFYQLTGVKNFHSSELIKKQFDKNKGVSPVRIQLNPERNLASSRSAGNIANQMTFEIFLKSFELIALKLHPYVSLEEAMAIFIDVDLNKMIRLRSHLYSLNSKKNLSDAKDYLKKEEIVNVLNSLGVILQPHYNNYSNCNGFMACENFIKFYKDFGIFPEIVNLIQTKNIFNILADSFTKDQNISKNSTERTDNKTSSSTSKVNLNNSTDNEIPQLTFSLFLKSLALASFHCSVNEEKGVLEKIIYLMEKMGNSSGIKKSQLISGETFSSNKEINKVVRDFKNLMPEIFKKKINLMKSPNCFEELMNLNKNIEKDVENSRDINSGDNFDINNVRD